MKKDAPSGTAAKMAEVIAEALGRRIEETGIYGRHGLVGERTTKEIGVHALRGGTWSATTPSSSARPASGSN